MGRRGAGLYILAILLTGCAGSPTRVDTENGLTVGFTEEAFAALNSAGPSPYNSNTVFIRLERVQEHFVATEFSVSRLWPASKEEEILGYIVNLNMLLPAYESDRLFNSGTRSFQCMFIDEKRKDDYHPCDSGSKLVSVGKGASVARNTVALPLSWGLATGVDYVVDNKQIIGILREQKLMEKMKGYLALVKIARDAEKEVRNQDALLQSNAVPIIRVQNNTGFAAPSITPRSIHYSFTREFLLRAPGRIDPAAADPFATARDSIAAGKAKLLLNRSYLMNCPANFEQAGFRGTVICDKEVTESNGTLKPAISVTLDALHRGTRFPAYEGRDKNISISIANNALVIGNLTNQYIEVQSLAVYGGKNIKENTLGLSLAPASENREPIPLEKLCDRSITDLFSFRGVRKSQVDKHVKFAIAAKYRVGESGNFRTFYEEKMVLLSDLIAD